MSKLTYFDQNGHALLDGNGNPLTPDRFPAGVTVSEIETQTFDANGKPELDQQVTFPAGNLSNQTYKIVDGHPIADSDLQYVDGQEMTVDIYLPVNTISFSHSLTARDATIDPGFDLNSYILTSLSIRWPDGTSIQETWDAVTGRLTMVDIVKTNGSRQVDRFDANGNHLSEDIYDKDGHHVFGEGFGAGGALTSYFLSDPSHSILVDLDQASNTYSIANGAGKLIGNGTGPIDFLIGNDGASLITNDGGSIIGNDGASIIGNDGSSLVNVLGLITNDGGSLITNDGGSLITNDGASFAAARQYSLVSLDDPGAAQLDDFLFAGYAPEIGDEELWIGTGTPGSAHVLKDINPAESSMPSQFTSAGDKVFFTAQDGAHGTELWVSDGTEAGTHLVKDINPDSGLPGPTLLATLGEKVLFTASDGYQPGTHGTQLWVSDGTEAGTQMLTDIGPDGVGAYIVQSRLYNAGGLEYFIAYDFDASGETLYRTDGTVAGTAALKTFDSVSEISPGGDRLYLVADDDSSDGVDAKLWVTDGTSAGTVKLPSNSPSELTDVGNGVDYLDFDGTDWQTSPHGTELFHNGAMVADIGEGPRNSGISHITYDAATGRTYFAAQGWHIRGFDENQQALYDTHGYELWVADSNGAREVANINTQDASTAGGGTITFDADSAPIFITPSGDGRMFFGAYDGIHGYELWVTDGTEAGTHLVKDINPDTVAGGAYPALDGVAANQFAVLDGKILFMTDDGTHGYKLWVSDGTNEGTFALTDMNPGLDDSPVFADRDGDSIYFTDGGAGVLWKTDGTINGTVQVGLARGEMAHIPHVERLAGDDEDSTVEGSPFDDTIDAGGGRDVVFGLGGNDLISGGPGADRLDGGPGIDTADYSGSAVAVDVSLNAGTGSGGDAEGDRLTGFENLIGSNAAAGDRLTGNAGDNWIAGLAGPDRINGKGGIDTADYSASADAVTVDLGAGTGSGGDAEGDTLVDIENLVGSNAAAGDHLAGSGRDNFITGLAGPDEINGKGGNDILAGGAGADALDGGVGIDTADYSASADAVTVSLASGTGSGGDAEGDTLVRIENIIGSDAAAGDRLTGDGGANTITGLAGPDRIDGLDGDDVLYGGGGRDYITGGQGNDTIYGGDKGDFLYGNKGNDFIAPGGGIDQVDGGLGLDRVWYGDSSGGVSVDLTTGTGTRNDAAGDTYVNIERVTGSAFSDSIVGNELGNALKGGSGDDIVYGKDGGDTIEGQAGRDQLYGGGGNDQLFGGADNDRLFGNSGVDKLDGGTGNDQLTGGANADYFVFTTEGATGFGEDIVYDFQNGVDRLDVRGVHSTSNPSEVADSFSDFTVSAWTHGVKIVFEAGQIIYLDDAATGIHVADIDASDFLFA